MLLSIIISFLTFSLICFTKAVDYTVTTQVGVIKGRIKNVTIDDSIKEVGEFLGIPFAEPPVGNLRFKKPVAVAHFTKPFEALRYGLPCPQYFPGGGVYDFKKTGETSEDCLGLNIHTPKIGVSEIPQTGSSQTYPVMIFIHGGGFVVGQSSSYSGDILAAYGQVIVVTINYRVGPFGFLSTGDDQAPGNYGLWDQHLAIQWVKNNIASFGGDTSRITIFGESSGSASVMYQTLFAGNNGLFQRAIAISGSATANWASVPKDSGLEYAKNLAIKFNCSVTKETESDEILKCLRSIDNATEIATTEVNSVWAPTPDNDFIREDVIASIKWPSVSTPNYQEFDLMLGTNGYEGHFFLHTAFPSILSTMTKAPITELRELFKNLVKITLPEVFSRSWEVFPKSLESMDQVVDAVMFAYSASENPNNRDYKLKQICDFLTDVQVFIPTVVDARNHAYMNNRTKTYQYEFNHQYPFLLPEDTWLQGATHGGALPFIFGFPSSLFGYTTERAEAGWPFAKLVMDYWTNFAKTGDPNKPRLVPTPWREYNFNEQDYLYFPITGNPENKSYPNAQRVIFWLDYITTLIKHGKAVVPDSTCTPTSSMSITYHNIVLLVTSLCLLCCW